MTGECTLRRQEEEEERKCCIGYQFRVERPLPWKETLPTATETPLSVSYLSEHVCASAHAWLAPRSDNGFFRKLSSYRVLCVPRGSKKGLSGTRGFGKDLREIKEGVGRTGDQCSSWGGVQSPLETVNGQ